MLYRQNLFFHTTYEQFFYILYGIVFVHATYVQVVYMLYGKKLFSIKHIDKLSIYCKGNYITIIHLFEVTESILFYFVL